MRRLLLAALLTPSAALAQLDKLQLSSQVQSIKLSGDLRLRSESSLKRGQGTNDRNRGLIRLRVAGEVALPHALSVNLRLASGSGSQTGANQAYSNLSSPKSIWIDQAFLKWAPESSGWKATLASGKLQNLLWRTDSSDLIWDPDFNPEGFFEGVERPFEGVTVFAGALQTAVHEQSGSGKSPWLFSQQAGAEAKLFGAASLRLAAAYHKWSDENRMSFAQPTTQDGNRRVGGLLANQFGVGEVTGRLTGKMGSVPVSLQGTAARNFRARDLTGTAACPAASTCPLARDGYQFGVAVGSAKKAGTWEAAWLRKYAQTDVSVADLADSDFGDGGTNRRGDIFWAAYSPLDYLQFRAKLFVTEAIDTQFNPGDKAVNRSQIDVSVRF